METVKGRIQEMKTMEGVSKLTGKPYTLYSYKINNQSYSSFKDLGFDSGDEVQLSFEVDGQYRNAKGGVVLHPAGTVEEEVVQDGCTPDEQPKQTSYQEGQAFGLACNLALRRTIAIYNNTMPRLNPEEFEEEYRKYVHAFCRINEELRKEIVK